MAGYMGKVLHVDLATREVRQESLDPEIASKFIGGMGLSTKILYDEVGPEVDPLGPDNVIIFATGPLTGTNAPASGRVEVTAKSPQNGALATGNTGGTWGVELKRAGYDALIVRKSSPEPVYLWIDDGKVEVRRADHLWGRDAWETTDRLGEELGGRRENEIKVVAIGPAGENLVRFASLINEYYHSQARGGIGAVMGSKKLKAIAIRGSGRVTVAQPEAFRSARQEAIDRIVNSWHPTMKDSYKDFGDVGPLRLAKGSYLGGSLPFNNFQTAILPQWLETNTLEMARPYIKGKKGVCFACPLACFNLAEVDEGKYAGLKISNATFVGPVFEFGGKCSIMSLPAIWKCKEVCHKLGMDIFSAGPIIAFAMELYQRGIIGREDTGGLALEWGDDDSALRLLEDIAHRKGLGDILAEGSLGAAERIGKDARKYAYTIKGLEMFGTDPRASGTTWIL
ncbi:MAG: aldehyde ferredoxin oxidoreductase family protein, partial [Dehalococcoidia bacterium]